MGIEFPRMRLVLSGEIPKNAMKYALMQPYFFPYVGYFALIAATDYWMVFDKAQYMKRGWIARNRVLRPNGGWQYITVPVRKHPRTAEIHEVEITSNNYWRSKLPACLRHYRKRAPYFEQVMTLLEDCLSELPAAISELNVRCLEKTCSYLGIPFRYDFLSTLDLDLEDIQAPGDWAWKIGSQIGGTHYLNPSGGRGWYLREDFEAVGIALEFLSIRPLRYDQGSAEFEPNLSIIDVAMFNSPEQIRALLQEVDRERIV